MNLTHIYPEHPPVNAKYLLLVLLLTALAFSCQRNRELPKADDGVLILPYAKAKLDERIIKTLQDFWASDSSAGTEACVYELIIDKQSPNVTAIGIRKHRPWDIVAGRQPTFVTRVDGRTVLIYTGFDNYIAGGLENAELYQPSDSCATEQVECRDSAGTITWDWSVAAPWIPIETEVSAVMVRGEPVPIEDPEEPTTQAPAH